MEQGYSLNIEELKSESKLYGVIPHAYEYKVDLTKLEKEFNEKEVLDGDMIEKLFFPVDESYDIFISHSHLDIDIAKKVTKYLELKGYRVFLDSKIWGSADKLLKIIDDKYSKFSTTSESYSYEKRNFLQLIFTLY